jgi:hypothetical protein
MEKFTGVRFDSELGEYEAVVCGEVETWANTAREAAAKLQECILWRATCASKTQAPFVQSEEDVAADDAYLNELVFQAWQDEEAREAAQNAAESPVTVARVIVPVRCETVAQRVTAAPRCSFYKSIRYCFAVARDAGLDTRADDAMRAAFAAFLGRAVPSRETLNGRDWMLVGNAIKSRRLAW